MDTELERLFALGLTAEEHLIASAYYRAKWTTESRKLYHQSHPENFAGPDMSYPIRDGSDVEDAAHLVGKAADSGAVRSNIIAIAKRLGLTAHLPASWTGGDKEEDAHSRAMGNTGDAFHAPEAVVTNSDESAQNDDSYDQMSDDNETEPSQSNTDDTNPSDAGATERAMAACAHEPFTGTHNHAHPHMDGYNHEHTHTHHNDSNHDHGHVHDMTSSHGSSRALSSELAPTPAPLSRAALEGFVPGQTLKMYAPIVRVDATKREVYGQATTEKPDAYGTIFGYNPDAWKRWRGNVREQHDPHKAVGRGIQLDFDETDKSVFVGTHVSRGAQDTWLKIEDGVLGGYSVSILPKEQYGLDPRKWPKRMYNGREYPFCPDYDVVELSLVDNPATPGCDIAIVRADGFANTDVLDITEDQSPTKSDPIPPEPVKPAQPALHRMRDSGIAYMKEALALCECAECHAIMAHLSLETAQPVADERTLALVEDALNRALAPIYQRQQAFLSQLARQHPTDSSHEQYLERSLDSVRRKVARVEDALSHQQELHASLSAVKGLVEKIAQQPATGGPIASAPGFDSRSSTERALEEVRRLQAQGAALTPLQQQMLASQLFRPM